MKLFNTIFFFLYFSVLLFSCSNSSDDDSSKEIDKNIANIVSVTTSGNENNYSFNVGILSPDKGFSQYANWWEVITEDGDLIYRRILAHSHVNEQPFIRSGGAIEIKENQMVIIRLHMNTTGYSTNAYKGSVIQGFNVFKIADKFAVELENQDPKPTDCAF